MLNTVYFANLEFCPRAFGVSLSFLRPRFGLSERRLRDLRGAHRRLRPLLRRRFARRHSSRLRRRRR